jgi:hypothetical protein
MPARQGGAAKLRIRSRNRRVTGRLIRAPGAAPRRPAPASVYGNA